jgi:hypothetical protein
VGLPLLSFGSSQCLDALADRQLLHDRHDHCGTCSRPARPLRLRVGLPLSVRLLAAGRAAVPGVCPAGGDRLPAGLAGLLAALVAVTDARKRHRAGVRASDPLQSGVTVPDHRGAARFAGRRLHLLAVTHQGIPPDLRCLAGCRSPGKPIRTPPATLVAGAADEEPARRPRPAELAGAGDEIAGAVDRRAAHRTLTLTHSRNATEIKPRLQRVAVTQCPAGHDPVIAARRPPRAATVWPSTSDLGGSCVSAPHPSP